MKNFFLKQTIKIFCLCLSLVLAQGCQTPGYVISDSYVSTKLTRAAVVVALGPARSVSQNGREVTTQFHDRQLKYLDVGAKTKERLYTKVSILGARRPFDVAVEVRIERKDPVTNTFVDIGLDEQLSRKQGLLVQEALHQSRDKVESIDGEVPF